MQEFSASAESMDYNLCLFFILKENILTVGLKTCVLPKICQEIESFGHVLGS